MRSADSPCIPVTELEPELLSFPAMDDVAAALAAENRRLRAETRRLEERLRAIEASRWHRVNPRRLLRRLRSSAASPEDVAQGKAATPIAPVAGEGSRELAGIQEEVVGRGRFTHFWALRDLGLWEPIFAALDRRESHVLEVGCFEGLWTCIVLWRLPEARVTCVDTFQGGLDHAGTDTVPPGLETIFDHNVAVVDASRVRKLVGESKRRLVELVDEQARFDLVYVDGSHLGLDVLVDAALSWQLLETGGYLVFDDYRWAELGRDALLRPGPSIDAFLTLVEGKYEPLLAGEKVIVRKTP